MIMERTSVSAKKLNNFALFVPVIFHSYRCMHYRGAAPSTRGQSAGQNIFGAMYTNGQNVSQDHYAGAAKWYGKVIGQRHGPTYINHALFLATSKDANVRDGGKQ